MKNPLAGVRTAAFTTGFLAAVVGSSHPLRAEVPITLRYSLTSTPDEGTTIDEQKAAQVRGLASCLFQESPQTTDSELEYSLYQWWSGADGAVPSEKMEVQLREGGQSFNMMVSNLNEEGHPGYSDTINITIYSESTRKRSSGPPQNEVKLADFGLDGKINYGRDDLEGSVSVFDEGDYDGDGQNSQGLEQREYFQEKYGLTVERLARWCDDVKAQRLKARAGGKKTTSLHYPLVIVPDEGRTLNQNKASPARSLANYVLHQRLQLNEKDFRSYHHHRNNAKRYQQTTVFFQENNLLVQISVDNHQREQPDTIALRVDDRWSGQSFRCSDVGLDGHCNWGYEEQKKEQTNFLQTFDSRAGKGLEHQDYFQKLYEHALDRLLQYYEGKK